VARQLKAQAQTLAHDPARAALEQLAQADEAQAKSLTVEALDYVRQNPRLSRPWTLLQSAPGVGPLVAAELVAHTPELGRVSGRALAKLAGLAPFVRQSGTWKGRATCSGGRARPRQLHYLAVVASLRAKAGMRPIYEALVSRGKPPKVAITACMRRLLVALGAMMRDETPRRTQPT
jgi:transposase